MPDERQAPIYLRAAWAAFEWKRVAEAAHRYRMTVGVRKPTEAEERFLSRGESCPRP